MRLIDADKVIEKLDEWIDPAIQATKWFVNSAPTIDAVSRGVYEQCKWERDMALETLEEHGLSLGQSKDAETVRRSMNRQEAVNWLEQIKEKYITGGDEEFDKQRKIAVDMAIEVLQEPVTHDKHTETHGVCLDTLAMTREKALHELGEWLEQMIQHGVPSHSAKRKALETSIVLLSADAVHGKWIVTGKTTKYCVCSECGEAGDEADKFCRTCGAKMDKE